MNCQVGIWLYCNVCSDIFSMSSPSPPAPGPGPSCAGSALEHAERERAELRQKVANLEGALKQMTDHAQQAEVAAAALYREKLKVLFTDQQVSVTLKAT